MGSSSIIRVISKSISWRNVGISLWYSWNKLVSLLFFLFSCGMIVFWEVRLLRYSIFTQGSANLTSIGYNLHCKKVKVNTIGNGMIANSKRLNLNFIVFFASCEDTPRLLLLFKFYVMNEIQEAKCRGGLKKFRIKNRRGPYYPGFLSKQKQADHGLLYLEKYDHTRTIIWTWMMPGWS